MRIISELKDEISVLKISGSKTEAEKEIRNLKVFYKELLHIKLKN